MKYPTEDKKVNELLNYLEDSDPHYRTESFPRIVERVNFFKEQKEGVDIMCEIADRIRRETDLSVLDRWIRCAASASSIAEFEARM